MTSHSNNDDKEGDLYEPSSIDIKFEETNTDEVNEKISKSRNKRISGIWSIPYTVDNSIWGRFSRRTTVIRKSIATFFTNSIDFCRVFIYNVYCKHKQHERIKIVNKEDNTKSKKNTKNNTRKGFSIDWAGIGRGIMGLGLFLLVASEIFATIVIVMGTGKDLVPKVLVAPIAIHAFIILVKVFTSFTSRKGEQ